MGCFFLIVRGILSRMEFRSISNPARLRSLLMNQVIRSQGGSAFLSPSLTFKTLAFGLDEGLMANGADVRTMSDRNFQNI